MGGDVYPHQQAHIRVPTISPIGKEKRYNSLELKERMKQQNRSPDHDPFWAHFTDLYPMDQVGPDKHRIEASLKGENVDHIPRVCL